MSVNQLHSSRAHTVSPQTNSSYVLDRNAESQTLPETNQMRICLFTRSPGNQQAYYSLQRVGLKGISKWSVIRSSFSVPGIVFSILHLISSLKSLQGTEGN